MAAVQVQVVPDYDAMSEAAADIVAETIAAKPTCALCVPTGNTPLGMFQRLIDRVERGEISFAGNQLFCLDEYVGIDEEDPESLTRWLNRSFLEPARISVGNIHTLPTTAANLEAAAAAYEREIADAGGLELAVLGLGGNGHIAYNEPGSTGDSRTRVLTLTDESIEQAEGYFEGRTVPTEAMTVGVGTLLEARRIVVIVSGGGKADGLHAALRGEMTPNVPASHLQLVPDKVLVIADADAAARL